MELRQENLEFEAILGYILRSPSPEKKKMWTVALWLISHLTLDMSYLLNCICKMGIKNHPLEGFAWESDDMHRWYAQHKISVHPMCVSCVPLGGPSRSTLRVPHQSRSPG
jgi:hypothetical protein